MVSTHIAVSYALLLSAAAAISDWRSGTIPNWLTLPPLVLAPIGYGFAFGPSSAAHSLAASLVSGAIPYFLFRRHAMGGGDVKLFAALGALTGFDPLLGLRIELGAFATALAGALCVLCWNRRLFSVMRSAFSNVFCVRAMRLREPTSLPERMTPVKLGGPVLIATLAHCVPHLPWARP